MLILLILKPCISPRMVKENMASWVLVAQPEILATWDAEIMMITV
jgi:hypothetical protein